MSRQIEMVGGPFDGRMHEVYKHIDPDMIDGFSEPDENGRDMHYYKVRADGRAHLEKTYKNNQAAILPSTERQLEDCTAVQRLEVFAPYCGRCGSRHPKDSRCKCGDVEEAT